MPTDGSDATTPLDTSPEIALADKDYNVRREAIRSLYLSAEEERDAATREQQHHEVFDLMNEYCAPYNKVSTGITMVDTMLTSFVPSDSKVPKGFVQSGGKTKETYLDVDNDNLWEPFKEFCKLTKEKSENLGLEIPNATGLGTEEQAAVKAAQEVILNYLGRPNSETIVKNTVMYREGFPKLSSFKGNATAVCTEMGVLAHNLLSFAGIESILVMGGTYSLWDNNGTLMMDEQEGHVFIVFRNLNGKGTYLFDVTNPGTVESNGTQYISPYVRSLDQDNMDKLFTKRRFAIFKESGVDRGYAI